jgi:hypothetical protein
MLHPLTSPLYDNKADSAYANVAWERMTVEVQLGLHTGFLSSWVVKLLELTGHYDPTRRGSIRGINKLAGMLADNAIAISRELWQARNKAVVKPGAPKPPQIGGRTGPNDDEDEDDDNDDDEDGMDPPGTDEGGPEAVPKAAFSSTSLLISNFRARHTQVEARAPTGPRQPSIRDAFGGRPEVVNEMPVSKKRRTGTTKRGKKAIVKELVWEKPIKKHDQLEKAATPGKRTRPASGNTAIPTSEAKRPVGQ